MPSSTYFDLPGHRIHICSRGASDPTLVLLHGIGRNGRDFQLLFPWLLEWRTLAWDLRGHGLSSRTGGNYRLIDYAQDLELWLQHEFDTGSPVVIYGHSLGALLAARVAATCPQRVRAIVLEDPPAPALISELKSSTYFYLFSAMQQLAGDSTRSVESLAASLAEVKLGVASDAPRLGDIRDPATLRFSARCLQTVDPEVFTPLLENRLLDGCDFEATLESIRCPVLLLYGDVRRGGMLPEPDVRKMVPRISNLTPIKIPEAGHLLHWMALDSTIQAVLSFLESL